MTVALYADHNVSADVVGGLRARGVDVLTAYEDSMARDADASLLDRATSLDRVFVTHDKDLLVIAGVRQRAHVHFAGIAFAPQEGIPVRVLIEQLELVAKVGQLNDFANRVEFFARL